MPISHQHKLIFIHIPKTGGKSIESAFGIQGYDNKGDNKKDLSILFGESSPGKYLQHYTISELLRENLITDREFEGYFKFAFVRNPWERIVSEYFWRKKRQKEDKYSLKGKSFKEFVFSLLEQNIFINDHLKPQHDFVTDNTGKIIVDYVGRFEKFNQDFMKICKINQIKDIQLFHIGKSNHNSYLQYYDEDTRKIIANTYEKDINIFGYQFNQTKKIRSFFTLI